MFRGDGARGAHLHVHRGENPLLHVRVKLLRYSYKTSLFNITTLVIQGCILFYNLAITFDAAKTGLAAIFKLSAGFANDGSFSGNNAR
jgi:hypothetical protein